MCPVPPAQRSRRCACAYRSRPPERESSFLLPFGFFRRSGRVGYLLHMHEDSALVHLRPRVTRFFPRQHFGGIGLGIVLGPVAESRGLNQMASRRLSIGAGLTLLVRIMNISMPYLSA